MKWNSIEERRPKPLVSVLLYLPEQSPFPTVREGFLLPNGEFFVLALTSHTDIVTHWAEMPEFEDTQQKDGEMAKVKELIELLKKCPQEDIVMAEIQGEEESAEIVDVLVGGGTTKGFTYIAVKPYEENE